MKKRRNKPTKKRNCPAILHIREVVMFPAFALDMDRLFDTKYHLRQEKTSLILKLKKALLGSPSPEAGVDPAPLNGMQRFYINLPLPEAHSGHPQPVGGIAPTIHPMVTAKMDELLALGIYDARHVRVIVHDYVRETVLKEQQQQPQHPSRLQGGDGYPFQPTIYPNEHDIADYIYISSITAKPTVIVENDVSATVASAENAPPRSSADSEVKNEMEGTVDELVGFIQRCRDEKALTEVKESMDKIIRNVKKLSSSSSAALAEPTAKRRRAEKQAGCVQATPKRSDVTQVVIYDMQEPDEAIVDVLLES